MVWWHIVLTVVISYLCGNISFARIISRSKNKDITKLGSGNPGMTNTLRNFGFKFGLLNLILDMLKAFVPSLVSFYVFGKNDMMLYIAGFSSIIGHMFPVVYGFKGGKGVSSTLGMFFAANPIAASIVLFIAVVIWLIFEYGSVVSFFLMTSLTVIEGIRIKAGFPETERKIVCLILFVLFLMTWYAHRKNIERLLLGKENKASIIKKTKKKLKKSQVGE